MVKVLYSNGKIISAFSIMKGLKERKEKGGYGRLEEKKQQLNSKTWEVENEEKEF